MIEKIIHKLLTNKKATIFGLGTFYLLPRRKGKVSGFGEDKEIRYNNRIRFIPSINLKDKTCK